MRRGKIVGEEYPKKTDKKKLAELMVGRTVNLRTSRKKMEQGEVLLEVNGLSILSDNKEYVLFVLTSNKFMDVKKIKGSDLVNMEKKRGNDRKTVEVQGNFFPISFWKLNIFFEHEKTIEGKKYYIGYSDHEEHSGTNIQNLFILTDNLDIMNMNDNIIKNGLKEVCCDCKLIKWNEVEDSVYNIENYIPCNFDNIKINKQK